MAYATNMRSTPELTELAAEVAEAATPAGRLLRLTALRQAVDAAMVAALAELEAAPGPVLLDGAVDTGHWLASRSEIHPAEAKALAGLSRDLPAMPATGEALAAGRVGVEKARILGTARDVAGFEPGDHGLVELPVVQWRGWLFAHARHPLGSPEVVAFADHLGALDDLLAPYRLEDVRLGERHTYEVAANWKVVAENYHECYHCPQIHPELCRVSPPASGANYTLPGAWVGGSMELRSETMSLSGRSAGPPLPAAPVGRVEYLGLVPNLLLSLHPDYVMTHRLVPLAPDRTWVECSWYFGSADVDPSYAVEFWDLVNSQDWRACESVQRGLASPHFRPGPFAPNEDAVHRWVTMIGRAYRGKPPHLQEG